MSKILVTFVLFGALVLGEGRAAAQANDSVLNGVAIGAAIGAGAGVAFTHAVRDSDLVFSQYARSAVIFGAIGAGAGAGIDALFSRAPAGTGAPPKRVLIAPSIWRGIGGVMVRWKW